MDTSFEDKFVTFRRRVLWLIVQKDIKVNKLSKLLLAKAVAAQDETFPLDSQFGIFSLEGKLMFKTLYEWLISTNYNRKSTIKFRH